MPDPGSWIPFLVSGATNRAAGGTIMAREIPVAALTAVPEGEARGFEVEGVELVLCNVDGEIYALQGMCTHQDLPLDGGEVEGGVLTCEWHGAEFDVCTGAVRTLPATRRLRTFETRVTDGRIYVRLDDG
jgi:3-phenylpropionate/trans-cinnamate dioxygenase ferredoxin component